MKLSLLFTVIVASLSSTAIAAAVRPVRHFFLKVASNGPSPIAGKYLTPSVGGGSLGIFAGQARFRGYMRGGVIQSSSSNDKVFLRPTHGTPQYYVRLGNPADDSTPALVLYKDFVVSWLKSKYWLDYKPVSNAVGARSKNWVACGGKDGHTFYFSPSGAAGMPGCTAPFQLEVVYPDPI